MDDQQVEKLANNTEICNILPGIKWIQVCAFPSLCILGIFSNGSFLYILSICRRGKPYSVAETTFRQLATLDMVFLSMYTLQSLLSSTMCNINGLAFTFCILYQFFEDMTFFASILVLTLFSQTLSRSGRRRGPSKSKGIAELFLVSMSLATILLPLNLLNIDDSTMETPGVAKWSRISGKCSSQSSTISVTLFGSRALLYFMSFTVCFVYWLKTVILTRTSKRPPKLSTDTPIGRLRHIVRKRRHQNTEKYAAVAYSFLSYLAWLPLNGFRSLAASYVMSGHVAYLMFSGHVIYIFLGTQILVLTTSALRPLLVPLLWKRYRDVVIDNDRLVSVPMSGSPQPRRSEGRAGTPGRFSPRSPALRHMPRQHKKYAFSFEKV